MKLAQRRRLRHIWTAHAAVCPQSFTYDALGRLLSEAGPLGTMGSVYDAAGRRTSLVHPDGLSIDYVYNVLGEMTQISQSASGSSLVLATVSYDDSGRRTQLARGNGTTTNYSYDPVSRLASLTQNLAGTANDVTLGFGYSALN